MLRSSPSLLLIQISILLTVALYFANSPDFLTFPFHLTVGRWILHQQTVPQEDLWTVFGEGKSWVSDSWLFDLVVASLERFGGSSALVACQILLVFTMLGTASFILTRAASDRFVGTLLALLLGAALLHSSPFDPKVISYTLLLAQLGLVSSKLVQVSQSKFFYSSFLLAVVHVNVHSSFLIAAVVCSVLGYLHWRGADHRSPLKLLAAYLILWVLASCCSPYVGGEVYAILSYWWAEALAYIAHPLRPGSLLDFEFAFLVLFWIVIFMIAVAPVLRKTELFVMIICSLVGALDLRFTPYALILLSWAAATVWGRVELYAVTGFRGKFRDGIELLRERCLSFVRVARPIGIVWFLLCLAIVFGFRSFAQPAFYRGAPQVEVDFILAQPNYAPVIHSNYLGAYLIYRFSNAAGVPLDKAMLDRRSSAFRPESPNFDYSLNRDGGHWGKLIEATRPRTAIVADQDSLCHVLASDFSWKVVFANGNPVTQARFEPDVCRKVRGWIIFQYEE